MKIYVLPVDERLQPGSQPFVYPSHNADYGVEQDFLRWLHAEPGLTTDDPSAADWHVLPVFWTRWALNHDYGQTGRDELAQLAGAAILDDDRTFTICQLDDGPSVDLGRTTVFLASRQGAEGIDIPLLCEPHRVPSQPIRRSVRASFVGRLATHPIRQAMAEALVDRWDVEIHDRASGTEIFVETSLASHVVLSPRGYGGSSFRFFEAAQLGRVPMLVGDLDTRPFKHAIDWSAVSLYAADAAEVPALLDSVDEDQLVRMGAEAARIWAQELTYRRWCRHVLGELERIERPRPALATAA